MGNMLVGKITVTFKPVWPF